MRLVRMDYAYHLSPPGPLPKMPRVRRGRVPPQGPGGMAAETIEFVPPAPGAVIIGEPTWHRLGERDVEHWCSVNWLVPYGDDRASDYVG